MGLHLFLRIYKQLMVVRGVRDIFFSSIAMARYPWSYKKIIINSLVIHPHKDTKVGEVFRNKKGINNKSERRTREGNGG